MNERGKNIFRIVELFIVGLVMIGMFRRNIFLKEVEKDVVDIIFGWEGVIGMMSMLIENLSWDVCVYFYFGLFGEFE